MTNRCIRCGGLLLSLSKRVRIDGKRKSIPSGVSQCRVCGGVDVEVMEKENPMGLHVVHMDMIDGLMPFYGSSREEVMKYIIIDWLSKLY